MADFEQNNNPRPKAKGIHHANLRDKKKADKRLNTSFRKTGVNLTLEKDKHVVKANIVLTEIMPSSAYVFVQEKIAKGTLLTLHLTEPLAMDVRARVRYCESADRNAGVKKSAGRTNYRMMLEFNLVSQLERDAMQDFYQQVRDESYVATKWHHYISQKAQAEAKTRLQEIKIAERVKEAQDTPDLAKEEMLVDTSKAKEDDKKNESDDGSNQAA